MAATYEQVAELFARAKGMGKGNHHERLSTFRSNNPEKLYIPNNPNTTESDSYGAWDVAEIPAQDACLNGAISRIRRITYLEGAPKPDSSFQNIKFEKKNHIAYVTIDRPKVLNALNMATMQELKQAFASIKDDADVRVVIVTGAGEKAFVAGADIGELSQHTPVSAKEYTHQGQAIIDSIENLGKPVIACINGFALGGGCELAMACTMRLASDNAKLGQPEVKLGLIPGYGGTQRLPRLVGKGLAMQQILTGEMISAQEAHRIGLVNEVVAAAELMPRAEAIAAKIIANSPLAIQYAMEAVNHGYDMPLADGLFLEATLFGVCCSTEDKNEGTKAFLEKRPAQFKGK